MKGKKEGKPEDKEVRINERTNNIVIERKYETEAKIENCLK